MGRLQKALSSIITFYQGAFIQDRQILDGVPIVNECIHSKLKANTPELLCKQDQGNAVVRVEWDLLIYLLCRMGFDLRWRKWIQESISSASFSILINGSPKGYFPAHGDLQQGDPLSLFLFVIVREAPSKMLAAASRAHLFTGFQQALNAPTITHL